MSSSRSLSSTEDVPSRDELVRQAQRCRQILKRSIVDLYLPGCIDRDHGGYLESLRGNQFVPTGEKSLIMQARQLWFFSALVCEELEGGAALAAARTGAEFLQGRMLDRQNGGYFAKVSDNGRPIDRRKDTYSNAFALYGLVAFYRATSDEQVLAAARRLFQMLEQHAHDQRHGGYLESFTDEWCPITDQDSLVGPAGMKTHNTHLHMLEAVAAMYEVAPDPLIRERLTELIVINSSTLRDPKHDCSVVVCHPDWRADRSLRNVGASYGHDLECVWIALNALRAMAMPPSLLRGWAEALYDYVLRFGFDRMHGGFFNSGPLGQRADNTDKEWWVQAEALVGLLEMYKMTRKPAYYSAFRSTLDFVENHQVAGEGSWWATCTADGVPKGTQRSSMWQGAYHNGRSMLRSAKLLEELALG
jgi:mannobiose 2-epimerase